MQAAIVRVLRQRLERAIGRPGWLEQVIAPLDAAREGDRFPPEYQAQLIEEACGDRYFRALQALDVPVGNGAHEGIASLAADGALRAIVTTNFDRLIERALERRGVAHQVVFDAEGFGRLGDAWRRGDTTPLAVIKVHGCVSAHRSMIDTLKQRRRGRGMQLAECLSPLHAGHWLYLGFSAADLDGDPDYLGLVRGADAGGGATYVAFPGNPVLGVGAQRLMAAHGDRGQVVVAHLAPFLSALATSLGAPAYAPPPDGPAGLTMVGDGLARWADGLSVAATAVCLAAVLEALGDAETAVRILDRVVRHALHGERDSADVRALQLAYGRLGAGHGRFTAVGDLHGAQSNASVETVQSLLRVRSSEVGFAASAWLVPALLWQGDGAGAMQLAVGLVTGLGRDAWPGPAPRSDDDVVDAWLCAAQALIVNAHSLTIGAVVESHGAVLARARRSGDPVRVARVLALYLLALAETSEDVPSLAMEHDADFREASRVGDGVAAGWYALALGRWHAGVGGLALAQSVGRETVAVRALQSLDVAIECFSRQAMDPWIVLALTHAAKAYADLDQHDDAHQCLTRAADALPRFPALASHVREVDGQLGAMLGQPTAQESFEAAILAAGEAGLLARRETLMHYLADGE